MLKTDRHIFKGMQKCLADDTFTIVFLTDSFMSLLGYDREELSLAYNNHFFRLVDDDVREYIKNELALCASQGGQCNMHFKMQNKKGKDIYLLFGGHLLEEPDGFSYYFSVIDITQYYEMDSYYKNLLDNLPIPVFVADSNASIPFINERGRAHFLSKNQSLTDHLCKEFGILENDAKNCLIPPMSDENESAHFVHMGDAIYQVFANAMPLQKGEKRTYCLAALDVSDIFTMNETTRALLENTSIGVMKMRCDPGRQLLYANEEYYELLGYSKAAWFSRRKAILHGLCEDGFGDLMTEVDLALASGQDKIEYEFMTTQQNGNHVWLLMRGRFDRSQEVPILNGVFMDITDRKAAEQELRQAQEWYHIALGQRSITVWEYVPEKRQLRHNESFTQVHGLPQLVENMPEALLEQGIIHPDFAPEYLQLHAAIRSGQKTSSCILKSRYLDGAYRWTKISYIAEQDEIGRCVRAIGFCEDISDVKNMQINSLIRGQSKKDLARDAIYAFEADITDNKVLSADPTQLSKIQSPDTPSTFDDMLVLLQQQYVLPVDQPIITETFSRQSLLAAAEAGETEVFCEYRVFDSLGHIRWMRTVGVLSLAENTQNVIMFNYTVDVDRPKRRHLAIQGLSNYQGYDLLLSKSLVKRTVQAALEQAPPERLGAVYVIALDNLQRIYAGFGKTYGDNVLLEAAFKLQHLFAGAGIFGEGENMTFVFYLPDVPNQIEALENGQTICEHLTQTYALDKLEVTLRPFTGIALSPTHGQTFETLFDQGQKALYLAQGAADASYVLFDPSYDDISSIHLPKDKHMDVSYTGNFCQNLPEFTFQLLNQAQHFPTAATAALQHMCQYFDAQCAYVLLFDAHERLYTAYQWQHPQRTETIPLYPISTKAQKTYLDMFAGCGLCQLPNFQQAPKIFWENQASQGASSVMEGTFRISGRIRGLICMNAYQGPRFFSDEQKSLFKLMCDLIGSCISAHTLQSQLDIADTLWRKALNSESDVAMIIDQKNYDVLYANDAARQQYPGLLQSGHCYECLYGQENPCAACPLASNPCVEQDTVHFETYLPEKNCWFQVTATAVPWVDGKTHYLVRNSPLEITE